MEKEIYYNELLERWFEAQGTQLAASSYAKYYQLYTNHIRPFFLGVKVSDLSEELLEQFRGELESRKACRCRRALSGSTVKCVIMLVNRGLSEAQREQFLDRAMRISAKCQRSRTEIQVFSEAEQRRLEAYLSSHSDISRACIYLCLYTGLRIGELCSLTWQDINMEEGYIRVERTLQRLKSRQPEGKRTVLVMGKPKSSSSDRVIPFPDFMREKLEGFRYTGKEKGYILSGSEVDPLDPRTLQYRYKKYLEEAEVPYRKFHTLRHTFASRCLMAGIDAKTLSELLGHADIRTTLNIYCHTTLQYKKEQVNRLQPFFS